MKIWKKIKSNAKILLFFLGAFVLVIPACFFFFYLRRKGKTISLHPKISIKEIKYSGDNTDRELSKEAIRIGEEILEKYKELKK